MSGLLCLTWNNHYSSFMKLLTNLHLKELYCDATIFCHGKYYPVHKLVLSTCSEYFEDIFGQTKCKHPFIIVKDVKPVELESLLNYMYKGEVNVSQESLPELIKAAEGLRIKGLAVPDDSNEKKPCERKRQSSGETDFSLSDSRKKRNIDKKEKQNVESVANSDDGNSSLTNMIFHETALDTPLTTKVSDEVSSYKELDQLSNSSESKGNCTDFAQGSDDDTVIKFDSAENQLQEIKSEVDTTLGANQFFEKSELIQDYNFSAFLSEETHKGQKTLLDDPLDKQNSVSKQSFTPNKPNTGCEEMDPPLEIPGMLSQLTSELSTPPQYFKLLNNYQPEETHLAASRSSYESSYKDLLNNYSQIQAMDSVTAGITKSFKCTRCPYESNKKYNVKSHFMYRHSNVRPICCPLCSFRCIVRSDLKRHMAKHMK